MVGGFLAAVICFWYYQTAINRQLNAFQWMIGGLVVFYMTRFVWTYAILKPLLGDGWKHHSMATGVMVEVSGALVSVAVAWYFRKKVMLQKGTANQDAIPVI
ncbi:MAG: hypothetical protein RIQ52_867 [Pseudomonadota bacterium]|jgi:hypothetical protein